jgi:hypothetical protein
MTRFNSRSSLRGFTFVDLLVVLCLVPLIGVLAVGCYRHHEGTSNRVKCSSNLRQISLAMIMYVGDSGNRNLKCAFPRTLYSADAAPCWGTGTKAKDPFGEGGPQANDVSAALFLVLRTQDITSETFTCPSTNASRDTFDGGVATDRSNFTSVKDNLSYSYQDPYTNEDDSKSLRLTASISSDYPILSDLNPGTAGDHDNVIVATTANPQRMKDANSNNHDGDGQNVAYSDAHVEWFTSPFTGVARGQSRDNMFTAANETDNATGGAGSNVVAHPVDGNDSILLPTDD